MIQQPPPSYNFTITHSHKINTTATLKSCPRSLPSILIDFTAMTLCDLMPTRPGRRSLPEFVFFVQKMTHLAQINARTLLVALIYLQRAKSNLPKRAVGSDDTNHRMFLGSLLVASKYLKDSSWTTSTLTNRRVYEICGGLFSLQDVCQLERAFLNLIRYDCFVDEDTLNQFVELHRSDFSL